MRAAESLLVGAPPSPLTKSKHPCYITSQVSATYVEPNQERIKESHESQQPNQHTSHPSGTMGPRPATDTRLLLSSFPYPVSLGNTMNPLRMTLIASAPSRPPSPQRHLAADACGLLPQMISLGYPGHRASGFAADARVPSPRMITHGSHPQRACPTTVDACGIAPRMISRSALIGVVP